MARELQPLFLEKVPLFAMSLAASIITFMVQKGGGAVLSTTPLSARLANALISYCRYLGKIFWPRHLAPFYPPVESWPLWAVVMAATLLVAISILAILQRQRRPWLLVGWFWFLGTLTPVIGLVQAGEQSMADRYSYLPSIGIILVVAWGAFDFCNLLLQKKGAQLGLNSTRLLFAISITIMIFCGGLTLRQISYWRDTRTLFQHALAVTENNYLAHNNVGTALDKAGLVAEAVVEFQNALRAKPNYAEAHNNLGVALAKLGRVDQAMIEYGIAFKIKPNYGDPHKNLGIILEQLGRNSEALREYQTALRLQPDDADAHNNLGAAFGRTGRIKEAIDEFEKVLALQPNSADAHNNLGVALDASGRLDAAINHFKQAVRLNPSYARAHFNLGGTLSRKGELDGAIFEFQEALRLKSDYAAARTNLAIALEMKKRETRP